MNNVFYYFLGKPTSLAGMRSLRGMPENPGEQCESAGSGGRQLRATDAIAKKMQHQVNLVAHSIFMYNMCGFLVIQIIYLILSKTCFVFFILECCSLVQFLEKAKKWCDMAGLGNDFRERLTRTERNYAVSMVIFKKFRPIFLDMFQRPQTPLGETRGQNARSRKPR
jgi:hypothetical protein